MAHTFIGTWETTWDSLNKQPHPGLILTVSEALRTDPSGKVLDGMYELRGREPGAMHGNLDAAGNEWTGTWMNSATDKGTFAFKLGANDSFTGTFKFDGRTEALPWYSTSLTLRHTTA